jgi:hypothetical protein
MYVNASHKAYIVRKAPRRQVAKEDLADIYKYLLISRAQLDPPPSDGRAEAVQRFISKKQSDAEFGMFARGKLRALYEERIQEVSKENKGLKLENQLYSDLQKYLKQHNIRLTWHCGGNVRRIAENGELRELQQELVVTKSRLDNAIQMAATLLEEKECHE